MKLIANNFSGQLPTGENYVVKTKITSFCKNKMAVAYLSIQADSGIWVVRNSICKVFDRYDIGFKEAITDAITELQEVNNINLIKAKNVA